MPGLRASFPSLSPQLLQAAPADQIRRTHLGVSSAQESWLFRWAAGWGAWGPWGGKLQRPVESDSSGLGCQMALWQVLRHPKWEDWWRKGPAQRASWSNLLRLHFSPTLWRLQGAGNAAGLKEIVPVWLSRRGHLVQVARPVCTVAPCLLPCLAVLPLSLLLTVSQQRRTNRTLSLLPPLAPALSLLPSQWRTSPFHCLLISSLYLLAEKPKVEISGDHCGLLWLQPVTPQASLFLSLQELTPPTISPSLAVSAPGSTSLWLWGFNHSPKCLGPAWSLTGVRAPFQTSL